ncbi:hypothetical protein Tco_0148345, partial [Tanacetum coccineum]
DAMDARSDVYVLSNGCKKCSDYIDVYYWEYTPGRYGVSVPALPKDHRRLKINTPYPEDLIRRIQDMESI